MTAGESLHESGQFLSGCMRRVVAEGAKGAAAATAALKAIEAALNDVSDVSLRQTAERSVLRYIAERGRFFESWQSQFDHIGSRRGDPCPYCPLPVVVHHFVDRDAPERTRLLMMCPRCGIIQDAAAKRATWMVRRDCRLGVDGRDAFSAEAVCGGSATTGFYEDTVVFEPVSDEACVLRLPAVLPEGDFYYNLSVIDRFDVVVLARRGRPPAPKEP
jgi:hypothetical protein